MLGNQLTRILLSIVTRGRDLMLFQEMSTISSRNQYKNNVCILLRSYCLHHLTPSVKELSSPAGPAHEITSAMHTTKPVTLG